jgi:SAM-dependent methyltransferase
MGVYERFAYFYAKGQYSQHSRKMAELLPNVLERFGAKPHKILDMACGEGTFARAMAEKGFKVKGIDASQQMIQFAKSKNANADFLVQDMRFLPFEQEFDLVTCWFDSLNYLLELEDLEKTFVGVRRALKDGGLFIFDMNTIYALAVQWQRHPCNVEQDTEELFEVHRKSYDFESNIATLRITGFLNENGRWARMDEEHRERGYILEEIRSCLKEAELEELACWGSMQDMSEPGPESGRVWFVTQKQV